MIEAALAATESYRTGSKVVIDLKVLKEFRLIYRSQIHFI